MNLNYKKYAENNIQRTDLFCTEFKNLIKYHLIDALGSGTYGDDKVLVLERLGILVEEKHKKKALDWPTICKIMIDLVKITKRQFYRHRQNY